MPWRLLRVRRSLRGSTATTSGPSSMPARREGSFAKSSHYMPFELPCCLCLPAYLERRADKALENDLL